MISPKTKSRFLSSSLCDFDTHLKELLQGTSIAFSFKLLGIGTGYIFTLLITRNLGAVAMGIFALSLTILNIFSVVGRLGLNTALLRFVAEYSSQHRQDIVKEVYLKAIQLVIPLTFFISIILFFVSPYLAKYLFNKEYLSYYFRLVSLAILPKVLNDINSWSLRGLKKIKEYSFLQSISVYLFATMIMISYLLFGKHNDIPLVSYIIGVTLTSIVSLILWLRNAEIISISPSHNMKFKKLTSVSLPMLMSSSLFLIMHWTDIIMLAIFKTEQEVGIYNVALRIATLTSISLFAINSIAAPKFAELYSKGDINSLGKLVLQSTKLIFWTSLPILLFLLVFPSFVLQLFGEEFENGIYALLLLTIGQFISAISGSVGAILQMTGKQLIYQYIILAASALNLILNGLLIPNYGLNGAAFASMISMAFWNITSAIYIRRCFGFSTIYVPTFTK